MLHKKSVSSNIFFLFIDRHFCLFVLFFRSTFSNSLELLHQHFYVEADYIVLTLPKSPESSKRQIHRNVTNSLLAEVCRSLKYTPLMDKC